MTQDDKDDLFAVAVLLGLNNLLCAALGAVFAYLLL